MEICNLKKINDMEIKERYKVKILNRFAAFENLDDDYDNNDIMMIMMMTWRPIRLVKALGYKSFRHRD
jgi:hypothetical protein